MGSIGGHVSVETLVAGNLPKKAEPSWKQLNYRYPLYSVKSGWNYGWKDMSDSCCIIKENE